MTDVVLALPDAKTMIGELNDSGKSQVRVELLDGMKVNGYVRQSDRESFTLVDPTWFQTTTIAYNEVMKVDKSRSELARLLIFMGTAVGVSLAVLAISVGAAGGV